MLIITNILRLLTGLSWFKFIEKLDQDVKKLELKYYKYLLIISFVRQILF